jgi:hypothetical protein
MLGGGGGAPTSSSSAGHGRPPEVSIPKIVKRGGGGAARLGRGRGNAPALGKKWFKNLGKMCCYFIQIGNKLTNDKWFVALLTQLSDFADLRNFFITNQNSSSSSGTDSSQSTRESKNLPLVTTEQGQSANVAQRLDVADISQASELIKVFILDVHLIFDPGLRIPIEGFHPDIRGDVKRAYLLKGPTRPCHHNFPHNHDNRTFSDIWFEKNDWLEYGVEKDAAFCFYCFLFKQEPLDAKFGHDAFTKVGFRTWKNSY